MKQVRTTIILSAFAAVSLITATSLYYFSPNETDSQNELIGEVFYPDFTDPVQASSLKLVVWDGENKETKEFEVQKVTQKRTINGEEKEVELWAIPDHDNYPVESPERLRETAGSVMNIERLSLASNSKEEHERLGVIDPLDENAKLKETNQIGDRIILKDDSGNTVCDLIVGNAVDAEAQNEITNEDRELVKGERYYVRQPDENETYVAELNLQITTEFSEWIDDDLLQVGDANVEKIQFLNYEVEDKLIEKFGGRVPVRSNFEEFVVQKENGSWSIDNLKSDTEELDNAPLNSIESELSRLSIMEVQPKPSYQDNEMKILNADLTVNAPPGMSRNDQIRIQQQVLGPQGFIIGLEDEKKVTPTLLSTNGELNFATDAGLVYHLVFGHDVRLTGEKFEFSGGTSKNEDASKKGDASSDESKDEPDDAKKGKIMSVHVTFDPELIEKPQMPIKPVPPVKPDLGLPLTPPGSNQPGTKTPDTDKKGTDKPLPPGPDRDDKPEPKAAPKNEAAAKKVPQKEEPAKGDKDASKPEKTKPENSKSEKQDKAKEPSKSADNDKNDNDKNVGGKNDGGKNDGGKKDDGKSPEPESASRNSDDQYSPVALILPSKEINQEKDPKEKAEQEKSDAPKKQDPKAPTKKKSAADNGKPGKDTKEAKSDEKKPKSDQAEKKDKDQGKDAPGDTKPGDAKPGDTKNGTIDPPKNPPLGIPPQAPDRSQEPKNQEKTPEERFAEKLQAYNLAMEQYERDLEAYEQQMKDYAEAVEAYEKKIEDNKKRVAELNARFADWFYIVDAADLEKVKLTRAEIVKPKEKTEGGQPPAGMPPNFNLPGGNPLQGLGIPPAPKKQDEKPSGKSEPAKKDATPEKKGVEASPAKEKSETPDSAPKDPVENDPAPEKKKTDSEK